jgi:hypothetical protein
VSGVTKNDRQRVRGRSRLAAARNTRSAGRTWGRATCRRTTASSCRTTTISSSLNSSERKLVARAAGQRAARGTRAMGAQARHPGRCGDGPPDSTQTHDADHSWAWLAATFVARRCLRSNLCTPQPARRVRDRHSGPPSWFPGSCLFAGKRLGAAVIRALWAQRCVRLPSTGWHHFASVGLSGSLYMLTSRCWRGCLRLLRERGPFRSPHRIRQA